VYIALPSAWMPITGRSGQATAAPSAMGSPSPIAPPVRDSQSCRGPAEVISVRPAPEVSASSTTIAFSGSSAPTTAAIARGFSLPVGSSGVSRSMTSGSAPGAASSASASSAATPFSPGWLSTCTVQSSGTGWPGMPG
jgi:hypothetical protein